MQEYTLKDRVILVGQTDGKRPAKGEKGTVVKLFKGKRNSIKTCGVLWDSDWPRAVESNPRLQPGRVFYYKPEDLKVVDTWSLD